METMTTEQMVLDVLNRASSQNPEILKPAEAKLLEWETQRGFYTVLSNIISNLNIDVNVRWIAVLCFKNGVDKYWRKTAPNAISEEEKQSLKRSLLSSFNEPVNQIATQKAVLIAKIARTDCPKEWNELLPTLMQVVESNNSLVQHRGLLTLHNVIKALCSKRLAGDRRLFQDFAASIFSFVVNLWNGFTEMFFQNVAQNSSNDVLVVNLEKALLSLRILRKLSLHGFYQPQKSTDCMNFFKIIFERIKTSLECLRQIRNKNHQYLLELTEKFIVHLTKVLLSTLDVRPFAFVDFIQPTLELAVYYAFTPAGHEFIFERFVIQCFNLIKGILLCTEYRPAKVIDLTKDPETVRAYQIKMAFFQPNTLTEICRKLVTHYFPLTQDELTTWDSDPENFVHDEVGESWKYSLRPSMETIFVTLFHEFRETLAPILLEMIRETNCMVSPDDMAGILKKDAVYNAVGLAAYDMYDEVDFDQWFMNTLTEELKVKDNNYRVIRRRVTSLIGNWTGIKLSPELRPALYNCVTNLLESDEDMAVRLTASTALRHAIDDFEFNSEQFRPYLDRSFNLLFCLLKEAKECETKMHVLNVMTLMVERVGQTISPHTAALIHFLPLLWTESEDHNMLRVAIVATLVQLVRALGHVSAELNPFLLPVIQLGTDVTQGAIVYLLEDSLELWLTVLENSPVMTNEFMRLFDNMPGLLEYSSENLRLCLIICAAHMLLDPENVMRTQGVEIIKICDGMMADMRNEGLIMLTRLVDTFIRANPEIGCETVKSILPRIFESVYKDNDVYVIMSLNFCILSRVLISSPSIFREVLLIIAGRHNCSEQDVLATILDIWIRKMRNVSQQEQRKLLSLALSNLLTSQSNPVLERFNGIMLNILETLNDITKYDDNGTSSDSLLMPNLGEEPSADPQDQYQFQFQGYYPDDREYETDHEHRKNQLLKIDPIHTVCLRDYLQLQIVELRNQIGPVNYQQLLQTLEADTLQQLNSFVTM
nr:importin-11 [Onthophagus taurus]XP_022913126.1 importin-11 [Onthophagus taurus]